MKTIEIELYDFEELDKETQDKVIENNRDINIIEKNRERLGDQLYKELEEEYWELMSDEQVKETLIANEYTFEKNGTMRNI